MKQAINAKQRGSKIGFNNHLLLEEPMPKASGINDYNNSEEEKLSSLEKYKNNKGL